MKTPVDHFHQDLFNLCKSRFTSMLHDGMSLPAVQQVANNVQQIAAIALQRAGIEVMMELGIVGAPVIVPPPDVDQSEQPEQPGPEEGGEPTGNPFV